jgi:hypothetical protein
MNNKMMNRLVEFCARRQNKSNQLNAGSWRECIKLVLQGLVAELTSQDEQLNEESFMPAKKKAAKKAKPMPKSKGK